MEYIASFNIHSYVMLLLHCCQMHLFGLEEFFETSSFMFLFQGKLGKIRRVIEVTTMLSIVYVLTTATSTLDILLTNMTTSQGVDIIMHLCIEQQPRRLKKKRFYGDENCEDD